jgi:Kef-type K+ transport system membrane component KefB
MFADVSNDSLLPLLRHIPVEDVVRPILILLAVIIVAARLFGALFRRLGQSTVVGEIAAGLVLGPSVLGRLWPEAFAFLFRPTVAGVPPELFDTLVGWILTTLSQIGLILLLFLVGLEFDFSHLRWHGKAALAISIAGVVLPFGLGLALAPPLMAAAERPVEPIGFALFLGTALAITAIPVLARMMMELNIAPTRLGTIVIAAAAVDDATGWILLATIAAVVQVSLDLGKTLLMVVETVGFGLGMAFIARPILRGWARRAIQRGRGELSINSLAILLALLFTCSIVTSLIGVFAVFGAFLFGAVLSGEHAFREAAARRLRDFVTAFFVPIFFTFTGLRTNLGSLDSWQLWLLCGLVIAMAVAGKLGGCGLTARLFGFSWREAVCIGGLMNTRGLMELIVINLGKDLGVLPDSVFGMLVLMALATTLMTTPILMLSMKGTELEEPIRKSGFFRDRGGGNRPTA